MEKGSFDAAKQILSNYLEQNRRRKTPERFAVLEAVYGMVSYFSIQDLDDKLKRMNFRVSRATLYNTVKLLIGLRLIISQRFQDGTRYKVCYESGSCLQICTTCGKITELRIPELAQVIDGVRLKRFSKESFSVYIYGTCSTCKSVQTRQKNRKNQ